MAQDVEQQPAGGGTWPGGLPRSITVPSGNTVEFRDPDTLRGRDQRTIINQLSTLDSEIRAGMDAAHGLACALISAWSYGTPLPCTDPDTLDDVPIADYNRIITLVAPSAAVLFGDLDSTVNAAKPGSPTPPASG